MRHSEEQLGLGCDSASGLRAALQASESALTREGHVVAHAETLKRIRPLYEQVPISRVTDLTPLDTIGIPVFSATTPLAKDLTVHAGKGLTPAAAELSAVMEAIERTSAERVQPRATLRASESRLVAAFLQPVVSPATLLLPYGVTVELEQAIDWVCGWDLMRDEAVWVPLDAVISPPRGELLTEVETNGLASGNSLLEAAIHALLELIERHAMAGEEFVRQVGDPADTAHKHPKMVPYEALPPPQRALVKKMRNAGLRVRVQDCTDSNLPLPVVAVFALDEQFPGAPGRTVAFAGYGADFSAGRALERAITEAAQAHTIVTVGARDDYEGMRRVPDRLEMLSRQVDLYFGPETARLPDDLPKAECLSDQLKALVTLLRDGGYERCVVVDVTSPDLGVPVVRLLVPGLAHPFGASARAVAPGVLQRLA